MDLRAIFAGATRDGDESCESRLNHLETRLERLELDHADRQVAVLTSVEKVLHQLRAREQRRLERGEEPDPGEPEVTPAAARPGLRVSTMRRLRGF